MPVGLLQEAGECDLWLELLRDDFGISGEPLQKLLGETEELLAIFTSTFSISAFQLFTHTAFQYYSIGSVTAETAERGCLSRSTLDCPGAASQLEATGDAGVAAAETAALRRH